MGKLIPYVLFAGAIGLVATIFYIDTLDMTKAAYQLPRLLIVLVAILLCLMLVERFVLIRKATPLSSEPLDESLLGEMGQQQDAEVSPTRIFVFVALLVVYVLTIKPLGYFIATPLFLIGIMTYLRATRLPWIILVAIGFTGFVYLLFVLFLNLPVPMGLLA